jgi:hypothetical protein
VNDEIASEQDNSIAFQELQAAESPTIAVVDDSAAVLLLVMFSPVAGVARTFPVLMHGVVTRSVPPMAENWPGLAVDR